MDRDLNDQVLEIIDEFLRRRRNGEPITVDDTVANHPENAQDIIRYLPTIATLEDIALVGSKAAQQYNSSRKPVSAPQGMIRFDIDHLLGSGGMSDVYLAQDLELGRQVALKIPRQTKNREFLNRFSREAIALAKISHPNVCRIYDVGEFDHVPYIAMEYIEGMTLGELLASGTTFDDEDAANLVIKISRAVQAAHNVGVVHRDLKPSNVIINAEGEPVVMDFGLALFEEHDDSELTKTGAILGSPAYMAPEQVAADMEHISPATDVYGLGVLLYQTLTGQKPYLGTSFEIMKQIEAGKTRPPSSIRPSIDSALDSICLKAMSTRTVDRYRSPEEFAAALENYSNPDFAHASPRWRIFAVAAIGVLICAASLVVTIRTQSSGTIIVKIPEDVDARIELSQGGKRVAIVGPDNNWSVTLKQGEYNVELLTTDVNAIIDTETVEVVRGETQELLVSSASTDQGPSRRMRSAPIKFPTRSKLLAPIPQATHRSSGRFLDSGQRLGNSFSIGVELGDLDGDGDLDAFVGNIESQPNRVWINQGDGEFKDSGQDLGSAITALVSLGDLDGDGDLDAVAANADTPSQIWINNGAASFTASQRIDVEHCHHVGLGDLDSDGDLDLVAVSINGVIQVWKNRGNANFVDTEQDIRGTACHHASIFDADGDGDVDVLISAHGENMTSLWSNDGDGNLQGLSLNDSERMNRRSEPFDIDMDGDIDAITCSNGGFVTIWNNEGDGSFKRGLDCGFSNAWNSLRCADLNGDGFIDCVGAAGTHFEVQSTIWLNDGNGNLFSNTIRFGDTFCQDIAVGDLDGDGDLDLFQSNTNQPNRVWINQDN